MDILTHSIPVPAPVLAVLVLSFLLAAHQFLLRYARYLGNRNNFIQHNNLHSKLFIYPYVAASWARISEDVPREKGRRARIAVYGAGAHTEWLHKLVKNCAEGPEVVAVLDDNAPPSKVFWGRTPTRPDAFDPSGVDAILLSSDTAAHLMKRRCDELYGKEVRTINFYEGCGNGPFVK